MSWNNWLKFLCWVGWHMWEYIYKSDSDSMESHRECKRCGVKQTNLQGEWV